MIQFKNGGRMVQSISELPDLTNATNLYLDTETTSFVAANHGFRPAHGDRIAGVCVTADDATGAWYIPMRHRVSSECDRDDPFTWDSPYNLPLEQSQRWLRDVILSSKYWVNHGIKFDMHFCAAEGINLGYTGSDYYKGQVVDTLTLSKLIDSDRGFGRGTYGLDSLSQDWLDEKIDDYEKRIKQYLENYRLPRNKKAHDYGLIPADVIGEYGCQDVLTNRKLHHHLLNKRSERSRGVWNTEVLLTPVLYDVECAGLRVNQTELQTKEFLLLNELLRIEEGLHETLGFPVASTTADCFEILINRYGLPVLAWNEDNNPSFNKDALTSYLNHPDVVASEEIKGVVLKLLRHRKQTTLMNTFVKRYLIEEVDGLMHPRYNQSVRTGRMSGSNPNPQQLSPPAKELIHPDDGCAFLALDYSQIEFRIIIHYIRDATAIQAYADDPFTDFHQWVADMCGIPRKPAKNVNFCIGFGGGKGRVISMLASDMALVGHLGDKVEELIQKGHCSPENRKKMFDRLCKDRGEEVFNEYHDTLPGLKRTTRTVAGRLKNRGYTWTAYGRERRLPMKASFRAFNSIVQGTAADVMKERTIAIAPRYNSYIRSLGMEGRAIVHDEIKMHGLKEVTQDPQVIRNCIGILEKTSVDFRVPIICDAGWSDKDWCTASGDDGSIDKDTYRHLAIEDKAFDYAFPEVA